MSIRTNAVHTVYDLHYVAIVFAPFPGVTAHGLIIYIHILTGWRVKQHRQDPGCIQSNDVMYRHVSWPSDQRGHGCVTPDTKCTSNAMLI